MDFLRTLLFIGLMTLVWKLPFRGTRPVRDFVLWSVRYPLLALLIMLFMLVIWGLLGADYGLQGLFFEDNPLIQFLVGATVMVLFASLVFHYFVLDPSERWWKTSLNTTTKVLVDLGDFLPPDWPAQRLLRNGYVDQFKSSDFRAISEAIHDSPAVDPAATVSDDSPAVDPAAIVGDESRNAIKALLQSERFRLLFSPAVLLVNSLVLVILLGVIPSLLIPLFRRDHLAMGDRLPWLLGIISGGVVGLVLACWTTRRLAASVGLVGDANRDLGTLRPALGCSQTHPSGNRMGSAIFVFLLFFFLIHVVTPVPSVSRWLQRPERTYATSTVNLWHSQVFRVGIVDAWRPTLILFLEAALAATLLVLWKLRLRESLRAVLMYLALDARIASQAVVRLALWIISWPLARAILGISVAVGTIAAVGNAALPLLRWPPFWDALAAFAFLGAFFLGWLACFWMAIRFEVRDRGFIVPVSAACVVVLVLLYFTHLSDLLVIGIASLACVFLVLSTVTPGERLVRPKFLARFASIWLILAAATSVPGVLRGRSAWPLIASVWMMLGILTLAALVLARVRRGQPAIGLLPISWSSDKANH